MKTTMAGLGDDGGGRSAPCATAPGRTHAEESAARTGRVAPARVVGLATAFFTIVAVSPAPADEPPSPGRYLYVTYCASCHGEGGRGDGPAAAALKTPPVDLTTLDPKAFPLNELMRVIDGRRRIAAHGSEAMPVWGERFHEELKEKQRVELTTLMRERALAEYVQSLWRK